MNKEERKLRVIARGEHSNHCHVITGDVEVKEVDGKTIVTVTEDSNACLKHLLESEWLEGREVWTKEHKDIPLEKGTYEFVQQSEYDPYADVIRVIRD
jgi:hypothetical protein